MPEGKAVSTHVKPEMLNRMYRNIDILGKNFSLVGGKEITDELDVELKVP